MTSFCPVLTLTAVGLVIATGVASIATLTVADYSLRELDMTNDELERELFDVYTRNSL